MLNERRRNLGSQSFELRYLAGGDDFPDGACDGCADTSEPGQVLFAVHHFIETFRKLRIRAAARW